MGHTSARLLALLSLLQARRDWPGELLATRLEVSPRTVRRDVDRLRELGYPIRAIKGPDGGYRLEAGSQLPPLLFDDEQAVALAVALRIAVTSGAGIEEAAARALTTVRQVLPVRLRHRVDALEVTPMTTAPQADTAVLLAIAAAIRAREVLRFDYTPPTAPAPPTPAVPARAVSAPPRRVEPHHLVTRRGRWYLVAWDLDRADWRTFRADRIAPRTPTGPRFAPREIPGGDVTAFVAAHFRGSATPDWPCRGEVVLAAPAEKIAPFAGDGLVEALGPDRCRLVTGSWSWVALAANLGRFDADLEHVRPTELREACRQLARRYRAAAAHADGATAAAATSDGASSDGATGAAATSPSASSDGAASDGAASDGASSDGAAHSAGAATDGAATDGAATDGAATDGAATDGAATDGAATGGAATGGPSAAADAGAGG